MTKYREKDFLVEEYLVKEKSTYEIAEDVDQHPTTIQKWLKRNNIDRRRSDREKDGCFRHNRNGYAIFKTSAGGNSAKVRIHRLQAVAKYGFEKVKNNIVHHKNGITWDNRFENLEVMSRSEHQKEHLPDSGGVPAIEESMMKKCWPEK